MKRARRLVMIIGGDGYAAAREIEAYGESYGWLLIFEGGNCRGIRLVDKMSPSIEYESLYFESKHLDMKFNGIWFLRISK